jgi:RimJ/RimL family protein N-acetyltransferase
MLLDTARLHLRPPVEQDADAIISIAGDWEVARRLARIPHKWCSAKESNLAGHGDNRFTAGSAYIAG